MTLIYIKLYYAPFSFPDQRVPAEDLIKFVRQQAYWLVPSFFTSIVRGPDDLNRIASALSTSANLDVFSRTLNLDRPDAKKFQSALYAVRGEVMVNTAPGYKLPICMSKLLLLSLYTGHMFIIDNHNHKTTQIKLL